MVQINACDSLTNWSPTSCTHALDEADKQEGTASIKITSTVATWVNDLYDPAGDWNWSAYTKLKIWIKGSAARTCRVLLWDSDGDREYWNWVCTTGWVESTLTFGTGLLVGTPDYTKMTKVQVYLSSSIIGQTLSFDDIRVENGASKIPVFMHHYGHTIGKIIRG